MHEPDTGRLKEMLTERRLSGLLKLREGQYFEAKGYEPYDLSTPNGRYELAKDVSSFANTDGGYVIIGALTRRSDSEPFDYVDDLELRPFDGSMIRQIEGVVRQLVFPEIRGLAIQFVPDVRSGNGIVAIEIPTQPDETKPFLVAQVVDHGEKVRSIVFGYSHRVAAHSIPMTIAQLQRSMRHGSSSLAQRLTRIEGKIDQLSAATTASVADEDRRQLKRDRIDELFK